MKGRSAWIAAALGVAGALAYRLRARPGPPPRPAGDSPDPRAEELRRRLAESRELVDERERFEEAETPIDRAEPAGPEERRRQVHEHGRAAAERMRRSARSDD